MEVSPEIVDIVNLLIDEGSRLGFAVLLFVFYLRVTSREHEKATALARSTADNAQEDLETFRSTAKKDIAELKSDRDAVRKELEDCKRENADNMRTFQTELMAMERRAHEAELRADTLADRVAALERIISNNE